SATRRSCAAGKPTRPGSASSGARRTSGSSTSAASSRSAGAGTPTRWPASMPTSAKSAKSSPSGSTAPAGVTRRRTAAGTTVTGTASAANLQTPFEARRPALPRCRALFFWPTLLALLLGLLLVLGRGLLGLLVLLLLGLGGPHGVGHQLPVAVV